MPGRICKCQSRLKKNVLLKLEIYVFLYLYDNYDDFFRELSVSMNEGKQSQTFCIFESFKIDNTYLLYANISTFSDIYV